MCGERAGPSSVAPGQPATADDFSVHIYPPLSHTRLTDTLCSQISARHFPRRRVSTFVDLRRLVQKWAFACSNPGKCRIRPSSAMAVGTFKTGEYASATVHSCL